MLLSQGPYCDRKKKEKRSDMKLNSKMHLAQAKWSMNNMGGGQGQETVTDMDNRALYNV